MTFRLEVSWDISTCSLSTHRLNSTEEPLMVLLSSDQYGSNSLIKLKHILMMLLRTNICTVMYSWYHLNFLNRDGIQRVSGAVLCTSVQSLMILDAWSQQDNACIFLANSSMLELVLLHHCKILKELIIKHWKYQVALTLQPFQLIFILIHRLILMDKEFKLGMQAVRFFITMTHQTLMLIAMSKWH